MRSKATREIYTNGKVIKEIYGNGKVTPFVAEEVFRIPERGVPEEEYREIRCLIVKDNLGIYHAKALDHPIEAYATNFDDLNRRIVRYASVYFRAESIVNIGSELAPITAQRRQYKLDKAEVKRERRRQRNLKMASAWLFFGWSWAALLSNGHGII